MRLAAVLAAAAIMALTVPVVILGQHGAAHANGAHTGLFSRLLYRQGVTVESDREQELLAVGQIWMVLSRAAVAYEYFCLVVIRRDVFVLNRPVKTLPVDRTHLEIVLVETVRETPPEHRAPADIARAVPLVRRLFGSRVRLVRRIAYDLKLPGGELVGTDERRFKTAIRIFKRPRVVINKIFVVHMPAQRPGVEHGDLQTGLNQHPGRRATRGARSDDHDVINRRDGNSSRLTQHKENPFFRPKILMRAINSRMF